MIVSGPRFDQNRDRQESSRDRDQEPQANRQEEAPARAEPAPAEAAQPAAGKQLGGPVISEARLRQWRRR